MPVKSKDIVGPCEVSLDIEVESGKVAEAVDRAYREFSKYIAVPGFRKGKAPMAFVRQRVAPDQLRERASELLIGPAYEQALRDSEVQPYAQPRVQMVKFDTTAPELRVGVQGVYPACASSDAWAVHGLASGARRPRGVRRRCGRADQRRCASARLSIP